MLTCSAPQAVYKAETFNKRTSTPSSTIELVHYCSSENHTFSKMNPVYCALAFIVFFAGILIDQGYAGGYYNSYSSYRRPYSAYSSYDSYYPQRYGSYGRYGGSYSGSYERYNSNGYGRRYQRDVEAQVEEKSGDSKLRKGYSRYSSGGRYYQSGYGSRYSSRYG
ncbi:peroxisomal membrane protein PEX13-like [Paramacrobiotus metropolitanus]|uniref:peroxisomal membrane protein PEX13-like n=1 Tax=Paramacrobiotus metropolitanus TaxID=2943436 RepID=UPI00244560EE|nr:peroxisomal membrane protein PEX13-like [Paramacrobiotus metropolitanus]